MHLSGNTVLITGGASGIGLAFAERWIRAGSSVIAVGRREEKLREAKERLPELHTRVCDVTDEADRKALYDWAAAEFPQLNVLVNNAGIQQRVNLLNAPEAWGHYRQELTANLDAPIHLSMLFAPHLAKQDRPAIINVTSGLAFTPMAGAPIYSATKAALHSFTMSLRYQLAPAGIEVIEVAPPAVNTDLGGPGLHTFGEPVDAFADGIFRGLAEGRPEIGYGPSEKSLRMSRDEIDAAFQAMNDRISGR
ncbi:SDR family oxidoreductase [Paenibacillus mucilaginosus]|uniref:DltE n=1 Tax=Paenibacillus mucilaginosus (strain KNP414) TaxID=1036673 RepID=F8FEU6_PAEMK|nr:SDR family NAD(P)-dependent oxidoreductase [Paenibacillus mucilaginosus]AEI46181.1 DltE [Paenibacillus mucilaginosus KNP414]MCG7213688.1 SDR family NAD(P)-dependent oxidoreductase [Paenibacillus mucilaginosus]WDM31470.1 SDR family NAD(P)-dependent oxidoreductase [Paenibacillus mucilaginosus]